MSPSVMNRSAPARGPAPLRVVLVGGLVAAALAAAWLLPVEAGVEMLRSWAEAGGAAGMVGFGAAYVVLALLLVPGAALTAIAGAVYGIGWGIVIVAIATSVADAAAFLVGRYVARDAALRLMDRHPRFRIVDRTISRGGWRIVALIRLNPTIPYSVSNYLFGVTGVSFVPFLISSGIFTLPGGFAYLYLGYVGAETLGGGSHGAVEWALLVLGLAATLLAIAYVAVLARRGLAEAE